MLIIFKSKVAGDIIMFEENAKAVLDALGRDVEKGIILADEAEAAIAKLQAEIERRKVIEANEKAERDAQDKERAEREARARESGDVEELEKILQEKERRKERPEPVSFAARVYPLMDMLKRAHKKKKDIVWGV